MAHRKSDVQAFGKAVIYASIAGASAPLAFTIILAIFSINDVIAGNMSIMGSLYLAALPLLISFPIVLLGCLIIGLPIAWLLNLLGKESLRTYSIIGTLSGLLVSMFILTSIGAKEGYWIALLGGFAGFVAASTWWKNSIDYRNQLAAGFPPRSGED